MNPTARIKQPDQAIAPTPTNAVDPKQETANFLEAIAQYNTFGQALQRATTMQEVGEKLSRIAEMAEIAVTNEASDWFDAHTLKRNMKEVKSYAGEFTKLAQEADSINQRMTALYDDMGRVLERYFEIPDGSSDPFQGEVPISPDAGQQTLKEADIPKPDEEEYVPSTNRDDKVFAATPLPPVTTDPKKIDALTLRAIKAVHNRLKTTNPEMAAKFVKISPQKMKEVVWELATRI